jgi:hypothetical protein
MNDRRATRCMCLALLALLLPLGTAAAQEIQLTPVPGDDTVAVAADPESFLEATAAEFTTFPRRRSTWVLLGFGGAAALLARPLDEGTNEKVAGSEAVGRFFAPGKWVGSTWVQTGFAAGLYLSGRYLRDDAPAGEPRPANRLMHLGFDLLRAQVVSQAFVHGLKQSVRRDRPTGECCAFPSGHAATAFATASVIERHFGYRAAWPTLALATYVGISRLHDNRHYVSDVVFGASLGMASGWTIVGRHGRSRYTLAPAPVPGGMVITLSRLD